MYTFNKFVLDEINIDTRRRILIAEFLDEDKAHNQRFEFSINETPDIIKMRVKDFLDKELNFVPESITDLEVVEPEVEDPDPETAARNLWLEKWREYLQGKKGMDALAEAGITPTEEETTRFEALKQWVADNRRIEYTQYL